MGQIKETSKIFQTFASAFLFSWLCLLPSCSYNVSKGLNVCALKRRNCSGGELLTLNRFSVTSCLKLSSPPNWRRISRNSRFFIKRSNSLTPMCLSWFTSLVNKLPLRHRKVLAQATPLTLGSGVAFKDILQVTLQPSNLGLTANTYLQDS